MHPKLTPDFEDSPYEYPWELEAKYPRIMNRIVELWRTPEIDAYLADLLVADRHDRQGFAPTIARELLAVSFVADRLRKEPEAPADPWAEVEKAKEELEQRGIPFTRERFFSALESGDTELVRLFLGAGMNINIADESGWTPLTKALFHRHQDLALMLIRLGADVHARDKDGYMPLHWAALNGYAAAARLILDKGADVNAANDFGWTALMQAAASGHTEVILLLLSRDAHVNAVEKDGWTALHKAVAHDLVHVVKTLLEQGADPNAAHKDGTTPLAIALENGYQAIARLLLEHGARPVRTQKAAKPRAGLNRLWPMRK